VCYFRVAAGFNLYVNNKVVFCCGDTYRPDAVDVGLNGDGEVKVDEVGDIMEVDSSGDSLLFSSVGVRGEGSMYRHLGCINYEANVTKPGGTIQNLSNRNSYFRCKMFSV
jgi:hypothetical protein